MPKSELCCVGEGSVKAGDPYVGDVGQTDHRTCIV